MDLGEIKDDEASARELLRLWMERAWRRPVGEADGEPFLAFNARLRKEGMGFDDAMRATFQSVLMSGPFRYLTATDDEDETLAQHAIASRLSFMLVGAPPDTELRALAAAGRLRDAKVLDAQVDRLLADPRSAAFWEPFVEQWLEMGQPITLVMDHIKRQDFRFGRHLKASMHDETVAYVRALFDGDRPARELIDSDWTMMNNVLAWHYGYEGVEGSALRKVQLRKDDPRGGGLLSHAGIQSMLCWMGDNWVIYRGAWTLRHILDDPPPPPPLEVPELDPAEHKGKSFKEILALHQEEENCAVCHRTMDPLGFAFQNFDISGRWREVEHEHYRREELDGKIAWNPAGKSRPVDAAGTLPRGEEFADYEEWKRAVNRHYLDDLVRGLMRNFVLYATGRQADVADLAGIREIMERHRAKGYPLKTMLKEIVKSESFLGSPGK